MLSDVTFSQLYKKSQWKIIHNKIMQYSSLNSTPRKPQATKSSLSLSYVLDYVFYKLLPVQDNDTYM